MNGNSILIDTNIAIYLLNGDKTLASFLEGKNVYISFVTELELLGFKNNTAKDRKKIHDLLGSAIIIDINAEIKERVVELRKQYTIKLPDAIITATGMYLDIPVISADKALEQLKELTLILYKP